jgi:hypothetical protein
MSTGAHVLRIIDALGRSNKPALPETRLPICGDHSLVVAGIVVGIALAAVALLWRRHRDAGS